jgi:short-subunit dehydrogenase
MAVRLKPVEEQVIVITGASSGIGLATARMAADRGARLVLVARNEEALRDIAHDCSRRGGRAVAVAADVAKREDLERVARVAADTFGGVDTWVNDAAAAVYGKVDEIPIEDQRRQFEVNYWGVVYGSLIAAEHLKKRGGGAIVNVGSVVSDRAMIFQTQYSASKHAVKAFTDGLRMELEEAGAPISVTLIKPSAIDTPYPEHARNYLDSPGLVVPPPSYDPYVVAKAILFAAETPKRTLVVGLGGYMISLMGNHMPRLTDFIMEKAGYATQRTQEPGPREPARRDNLYRPREDGDEHSSLPGPSARKTSLFLEAQMHSGVTAFLTLAGLGLALGLALRGGGDRDRRGRMPRREAHTRQMGDGQDRRPVMGPKHYAHRDQHVERPSTLARH